MLPRGDHDVLPRKQEDIVPDQPINFTAIGLTLAFFPALVAFPQAIYETLNFTYLGLAPAGGDTWVMPPGTNSTVFQCITFSGSTTARVAWAWGVFLILLAFGCGIAFFIFYLHTAFYGWELRKRNPDHPTHRGDRIHKLRQHIERNKQPRRMSLPGEE